MYQALPVPTHQWQGTALVLLLIEGLQGPQKQAHFTLARLNASHFRNLTRNVIAYTFYDFVNSLISKFRRPAANQYTNFGHLI